MRGHEYLVAIVSDHGVLRADTLRRANEIRPPEALDLPRRGKPSAQKVNLFAKEIERLTEDELDMADFEDLDVEALQKLAHSKQRKGEDVVAQRGLEAESEEAAPTAKIIDFMEVLKKSLSKKAVVKTAQEAEDGADSPTGAARSKPSHPSAAKKKSPARRKSVTRR